MEHQCQRLGTHAHTWKSKNVKNPSSKMNTFSQTNFCKRAELGDSVYSLKLLNWVFRNLFTLLTILLTLYLDSLTFCTTIVMKWKSMSWSRVQFRYFIPSFGSESNRVRVCFSLHVYSISILILCWLTGWHLA